MAVTAEAEKREKCANATAARRTTIAGKAQGGRGGYPSSSSSRRRRRRFSEEEDGGEALSRSRSFLGDLRSRTPAAAEEVDARSRPRSRSGERSSRRRSLSTFSRQRTVLPLGLAWARSAATSSSSRSPAPTSRIDASRAARRISLRIARASSSVGHSWCRYAPVRLLRSRGPVEQSRPHSSHVMSTSSEACASGESNRESPSASAEPPLERRRSLPLDDERLSIDIAKRERPRASIARVRLSRGPPCEEGVDKFHDCLGSGAARDATRRGSSMSDSARRGRHRQTSARDTRRYTSVDGTSPPLRARARIVR